MTAAPVRDRDRYGRSSDARADRRLRIVGSVLGACTVAAVGWFGWHYVVDSDVSSRLVSFEVVSDQAVEAHIEVHKNRDTTAVCTLRSQSEDAAVVGLRDVVVSKRAEQVDTVVTIRTTGRATSAELVDCRPADQG